MYVSISMYVMLFIYFFLVVFVNLIKAHSGLNDDEAKRTTPSSYTILVYTHGRGKNGVGNIKG